MRREIKKILVVRNSMNLKCGLFLRQSSIGSLLFIAFNEYNEDSRQKNKTG